MRINSLAASSFDTGNRFVNDNRPVPRLRLVADSQKPRLENFLQLPHVRAYAKSTQAQAAPKKNTVIYDQLATEQTIYAYVGGNPISYANPMGLSRWDKYYGLPKRFWNWYHRQIKQPGDPDLTQQEAEEWHEEWKNCGEPGPDDSGFVDPSLLLLFVALPPLVDLGWTLLTPSPAY